MLRFCWNLGLVCADLTLFLPLSCLWFSSVWACWVGLCLLRKLWSTGSAPRWWGREAHNVIIEFWGVITNSWLHSDHCSWSSASFAQITSISCLRSAGELALMTDSSFISCHPQLQILAVFWQNVTMNSRIDFWLHQSMTADGCLPLAGLKIHATAEMNDSIKKKLKELSNQFFNWSWLSLYANTN